MAKEFSPILLSDEVESSYRQYLETTFYFRDPQLRQSFSDALSGGFLCKGPFLEGTPVFKRDLSLRELLKELNIKVDDGFLAALDCDRPLYSHQKEAIKRVSDLKRNVVVTTGTASGKTEAFLIPILLHLYEEFEEGELDYGIRALILYPMNALANDQRERLGEIARRLAESGSRFRFSFGQYIGETPEHKGDKWRRGAEWAENRLDGELVFREEMWEKPPNILLTNYSMLEYLLLRPKDSELFDNGRAQSWNFLVLDEAHQYGGAKGMEMGMLLRRLKERLMEGGRQEGFQCIATSATIAGGENDKDAVAEFAATLFGEQFDQGDIVLGSIEPIIKRQEERLYPDDYLTCKKALDSVAFDIKELLGIAKRLEISVEGKSDCKEIVAELLCQDHRATALRQEITSAHRTGEAFKDIRFLADSIFDDIPQDERVVALANLVELLVRVKDPSSHVAPEYRPPLLSARYHLFLRSLEGAFFSGHPNPAVYVERKASESGSALFGLALCRQCGQHYLAGQWNHSLGKLIEPVKDPGDPSYGLSFFLPIENKNNSNGEEPGGSGSVDKLLHLCTECGAIWDARSAPKPDPNCQHKHTMLVKKIDQTSSRRARDATLNLTKCAVCGHTSPAGSVSEVMYGADGPHVVIATTLFQNLPKERSKILAFADGRQQAAFFAWYLQDTYATILNRNLIAKVVAELGEQTREGISLRYLAETLAEAYREEGIAPESKDELSLRKDSWIACYREFLAEDTRLSLEGVGLVRCSVRLPEAFPLDRLSEAFPIHITNEEAVLLLQVLLDFMRNDHAFELVSGKGIKINWNDLGLQKPQHRVCIGPPKKQWGVVSWDGKTGRRAQFLSKMFEAHGIDRHEALEMAQSALRHLWEILVECDTELPTDDKFLARAPEGWMLNPNWWRVSPLGQNEQLYQCDTCSQLQPISVRKMCTRYRCSGTLRPIVAHGLSSNHYRSLYQLDLPGDLRVEEHTAQIDKGKARDFQRDFKAGRINVLSSSTTFELGVNLGDLDCIFLRNVPPEAFNYAQRVGRSGRKSGYPGFAITYCQRRPHDLYHFEDPNRMIQGVIRPPTLNLQNEKIIKRHIIAAILSQYFRNHGGRFENVGSLIDTNGSSSLLEDLTSFIDGNETALKGMIEDILRKGVPWSINLEGDSWRDVIIGPDCSIAQALEEVVSDLATIQKLEVEASNQRDYSTAKWAKKRENTILSEDVPSFLSRKAVIPKYGFPVDVVELDTHRTDGEDSMSVQLQRDLSIAISEFAPSSEIIANKKLWTSHGIKKVAEREWEKKKYMTCRIHNTFESWPEGERSPDRCCDRAHELTYIVPRFGFETDRRKPRDPTRKPVKAFTTRPFFIGFTEETPESKDMGVVHVTQARPGTMVVLCEGNRGQGFNICSECGAAVKDLRESSHNTAVGRKCSGRIERVSLGHEFVTDVVQLRFQQPERLEMEPVWFAYSLAYALVEGAAETLGIPAVDLNTTIKPGEAGLGLPPIYVYDNVPGGAGLVARLSDRAILRKCLESAVARVSGKCGCSEDASCYGCLRSYRNQFAHTNLRRGPVHTYLEAILLEL